MCRYIANVAAAFFLALLVCPSPAAAQRTQFFSELLLFYSELGGTYGDEGPQISAHLEAMSAALSRWDDEIRDWERELRPRLTDADAQTALQVHTFLASVYVERGRFDDAQRAFDQDITIDPRRAAFPRFKGLIHQLTGQPGAAADAFWAAWLLDPADPQNAYRLIAFRSAQTTADDRSRALDTLRIVEQELVKGTRPGTGAPFVTISGIVDEAGSGMAFAPAAYARGFSLILRGDLDAGVAALRTAAAADPLLADAAIRTPTMLQGIASLRDGRIADAIDQFEATATRARDSSEAHRMAATAYGVRGDIAKSIDHLREALRVNPRDERSWTALVRTFDQAGRLVEAEQAIRSAIAALPDAGALRWQLAAFAARQQRTVEGDAALIDALDRYVLLAGRGDLYVSLARFAQTQLDFERAVAILEQAIVLAPNNLAAHKALGRAYLEDGREQEGYAELVVALTIDPGEEETRLELARFHLAASRAAPAVELLEGVATRDVAHRDAARTLGDALVRAGRTAEGEIWLKESDRLHAQAIEEGRRQRAVSMLRLQGEVRMGEGDYAGAIDLWRQLVAAQPDSASAHLRLADALVAATRLDEAAGVYQTAISLDAGAEAHRRLAGVYGALGRAADEAREREIYIAQQLETLRQRAAAPSP